MQRAAADPCTTRFQPGCSTSQRKTTPAFEIAKDDFAAEDVVYDPRPPHQRQAAFKKVRVKVSLFPTLARPRSKATSCCSRSGK